MATLNYLKKIARFNQSNLDTIRSWSGDVDILYRWTGDLEKDPKEIMSK